jgi:hypothetical protein
VLGDNLTQTHSGHDFRVSDVPYNLPDRPLSRRRLESRLVFGNTEQHFIQDLRSTPEAIQYFTKVLVF